MIIIKNTNSGHFLIALGIIFLFAADRNLLITQYALGGRSNIIYLTIVSILVVTLAVLFLTIIQGKFSIRTKHKGLLISSLLLGAYFFAHELIFSDGLVSAKYTVFLLIMCFSLLVRYNFFFVFKIMGYLGGVFCIFIVTQQILLLGITEGDLSQFRVTIPGDLWGRNPNCDYVTPFGLGLMENCRDVRDVTILGFVINRSLFFSTEPKYIGSILLITFSALLIVRSGSLLRKFFLTLHMLAFVFVGSASAIFILFFSVILVFFRYIGPILYTSIIFLVPVFVLPALLYFILILFSIDGFLLTRLMSFSGSVGEGVFQLMLLGESTQACMDKKCRDAQGLIGSLVGTYGLVGLSLFWLFLYMVVSPMFRYLKDKDRKASVSIGLMVMLNTYIVFNIYFFGDIFNAFGLFIILTLVFLPSYLHEKSTS